MRIVASDYRSDEILKMLREYLGLKQVELAEMMCKSRRIVQYYEAGINNYDTEFLLRLLKNVDLHFEVGFNGKTIVRSHDAIIILKSIREFLGLTQGAIATENGMHKVSYQQYEYGKRTYTFEFLLKLVRKYKLEIIIYS